MTDAPDSIDYEKLEAGEYDEDTIEAYNEQRRQEIVERHQELNEAEQDAVDALRRDAQQTHETEDVGLESGVTLEVRTRIPPEVEDLYQQLQMARNNQDISLVRRLAAALAAEMVESPAEYSSTEVWLVASRDDEAGIQWLMETIDIILEPVEEQLPDPEADEGNGTASNDLHRPDAAKQSGWQRQR